MRYNRATAATFQEQNAAKCLHRLCYFGHGPQFLGWSWADEVLQDDGTLEKVSKDGWRRWKFSTGDKAKFLNFPDQHNRGINRGVVATGATHVPFVTVDPDRHHASVEPKAHIIKCLKIGQLLRSKYKQLAWIAEINPRNGSSKFFGFTGCPIPSETAQKFGAEIDRDITSMFGESIEVFPYNCSQVGLPMRADKITIGPSGIISKIQRQRKHGIQTEYSMAELWATIQNRQSYDHAAFFQELKAACANLPYEPESSMPPTSMSDIDVGAAISTTNLNVGFSGDNRDNPNAWERQWHGTAELCRRLKRLATVEEALSYIQTHHLYHGTWQEGLGERKRRIAAILKDIAKTFDPSRCGKKVRINVGKYAAYAQRHHGHDWEFVSVMLSVIEFTQITQPNPDHSLPEHYAEYVWNQMGVKAKWNPKKWRLWRDRLEVRGVVKIVNRHWHRGQAMIWAVGECFKKLHVWWKNVKETARNMGGSLNDFIKTMHHTPLLNSYRPSIFRFSDLQPLKTLLRGPP